MRGGLAAVLLFLAQDLGRYCNHYLHHETRCLWPFHAVHHSAEVMTPITFMRAHPFYYAVQAIIISVLVGVVSALVLWGLVGRIENWIIYAGALAFNAYVFFGANIRHSHIWLSYGRVVEHILISPAQHQIHHSSDPKHHDKNYGEVFAIWDWIFGTLYIPDGYEELEFGLADRDGNKIPQKHPTLYDALVGPFNEVWEDMTRGTSLQSSPDTKS
jgi:sterol desaturase/sphingolipid hydroxylase (fatty acid hydroxylase superfamily)